MTPVLEATGDMVLMTPLIYYAERGWSSMMIIAK